MLLGIPRPQSLCKRPYPSHSCPAGGERSDQLELTPLQSHSRGQTTGQKAVSPRCFSWKPTRTFQGIQFCKHVSIGDKVVKWACFVLGSSLGGSSLGHLSFTSPFPNPLSKPLCALSSPVISPSLPTQRLGNACWSWDTFSLNHNLSLTLVPMPLGSTNNE